MKTIKSKIIGVATLYSLLSIVILVFANVYFSKKTSIDSFGDTVDELKLAVNQDLALQNEFFIRESKNPVYFKTGKSHFLEEHEHFKKQMVAKIEHLKKENTQLGYLTDGDFQSFKDDVNQSSSLFLKSAEVWKKMGFLDYGLIGEMRNNAHALESEKDIDPVLFLTIRRHEKDYLLRNDEKYSELLLNVSEKIQADILKKPLSNSKKQQLSSQLEQYILSFEQYRNMNQKLGLSHRSGLVGQSDKSAFRMTNGLTRIKNKINQWQKQQFAKVKVTFVGSIIAYIIISLLVGAYLAKKITQPLGRLKVNIKEFVESEFTHPTEIPQGGKSSKNEISDLVYNFKKMEGKLLELIQNFHEKVESRTKDLNKKNQELSISYELIREKNNEVLDSIKYAKRIQRAILPSEASLQAAFKDFFMIYQPKDIVSGDFIWTNRVKNDHADYLMIAVGDCTGHGVPGAFMSVLGINILNSVVRQRINHDPKTILNTLNDNLIREINKKDIETGIQDGMDIGLIQIDLKRRVVIYSGAVLSMTYLINGEIKELKGDRASIGGALTLNGFQFTQQTLRFEEVDKIYLSSDGIVDQFGGERGKKLKKKALNEWILSSSFQKMELQGNTIHDQFKEWKTNERQIDDVTMIGFSLDYFKQNARGQSTFDMLSNMVQPKLGQNKNRYL